MDALNYVRSRHIEGPIKDTHQAITEKFPIPIDVLFDAWYTNREHVLRKLAEMGREIARVIREDCNIKWQKDIAEEKISEALEKKDTLPENWEDGPDGTLSGVAILVTGWVANQAAAKSRDNPQDYARLLFEKCIRPLIIATMDFGIEMAERERKS